MKELDTTWSHIVSRKLANIAMDRGMEMKEIGEKIGKSGSFVSMLFGRKTKGNEENFTKIGIALGIPQKQIDEILHSSLLEAIEQEYGVGITFALKTHFKLSDRGVRDAMKFLNDLAKNDNE